MEPFKENFILTKELSKIVKARNNFLAELKSIEKSIKNKTQKITQKKAIKFYTQKKQSSRFFHKSSFIKFNEKEFARAAQMLSLHTMSVTNSRRITIRVNIAQFYSKLSDLGFYSVKRHLPLSMPKLIFLSDYEIINFYNTLIRSYLNWFRCADNFTASKNTI